jgi:hypothetical protein
LETKKTAVLQGVTAGTRGASDERRPAAEQQQPRVIVAWGAAAAAGADGLCTVSIGRAAAARDFFVGLSGAGHGSSSSSSSSPSSSAKAEIGGCCIVPQASDVTQDSVLERLRWGIESGDLSAIYNTAEQHQQQQQQQQHQQQQQQQAVAVAAVAAEQEEQLVSGPLQFAQRVMARAGSPSSSSSQQQHHEGEEDAAALPVRKTASFLDFPMFVPSLSWQNDRFYI